MIVKIAKERNSLCRAAGAVFSVLLINCSTAIADTKINLAIPWPDANFHTENAKEFARLVEERTDGRVSFIIHSGGSLGIAGPDHLRGVRDGLADAAGFHSGLQAGDAPLAGIYGLPYLIANYNELLQFIEISEPHMEALAQENGQYLCYQTPWPSQNVFTTFRIETLEDLKGKPIRTNDAMTTMYYDAVGVVTVSMPWADVVPALASGAVVGVTTSTTSAVDGALWEFLTYVHPYAHNWAVDWLTINDNVMRKLSDEDRRTIEALCDEVRPGFWDVSEQQDDINLKRLVEHGMVEVPPSEELMSALRASAVQFWGPLVDQMGPDAVEIVSTFRDLVGR